MAMTTEQVLAYAEKMHENDPDTSAENNQPKEPISEGDKTGDDKPPTEATNTPADDKTVSEDDPPSENGDSENKKIENPNKKPSKEEQSAYAFQKLKQKEKAKREKIIKDYESQISKLNAELEKVKDLKREHFESDEEYNDFRMDKKLIERDIQTINNKKIAEENANFDVITQERINNCFPDEKEREIYDNLIKSSAPKFLEEVDKHDPDGVVLEYLDNCEVAPLVIRTMMTRPEYRNEILSKKNPQLKLFAIDKLAKQLTMAKSIIDRKRNQPKEENKDTKPSFPHIGRVAKSDPPSPALSPSDPGYANDLLTRLNAARRGH